MFEFNDRFDGLIASLEKIESGRGLEAELSRIIVEDWAQPASIITLNELRRQAPEGAKWTENDFEYNGQTISHGRPSTRLYGTTLEQGWKEPDVWGEVGEGGFTISNIAPHIKWILEGTKGAHVTPTGGKKLLAWNRDFMNFGQPGTTITQEESFIGPHEANRFSDTAADLVRGDLRSLLVDVLPRLAEAVGRQIRWDTL